MPALCCRTSGTAWCRTRAGTTPEFYRDAGVVHPEVSRLAAAERTPLTRAERQQALDLVLPRIGWRTRRRRRTVSAWFPVGQPADVLPVIGWGGLANRGIPADSHGLSRSLADVHCR
jgi:hypothetical protein